VAIPSAVKGNPEITERSGVVLQNGPERSQTAPKRAYRESKQSEIIEKSSEIPTEGAFQCRFCKKVAPSSRGLAQHLHHKHHKNLDSESLAQESKATDSFNQFNIAGKELGVDIEPEDRNDSNGFLGRVLPEKATHIIQQEVDIPAQLNQAAELCIPQDNASADQVPVVCGDVDVRTEDSVCQEKRSGITRDIAIDAALQNKKTIGSKQNYHLRLQGNNEKVDNQTHLINSQLQGNNEKVDNQTHLINSQLQANEDVGDVGDPEVDVILAEGLASYTGYDYNAAPEAKKEAKLQKRRKSALKPTTILAKAGSKTKLQVDVIQSFGDTSQAVEGGESISAERAKEKTPLRHKKTKQKDRQVIAEDTNLSYVDQVEPNPATKSHYFATSTIKDTIEKRPSLATPAKPTGRKPIGSSTRRTSSALKTKRDCLDEKVQRRTFHADLAAQIRAERKARESDNAANGISGDSINVDPVTSLPEKLPKQKKAKRKIQAIDGGLAQSSENANHKIKRVRRKTADVAEVPTMPQAVGFPSPMIR
jgi:hypothetical protein